MTCSGKWKTPLKQSIWPYRHRPHSEVWVNVYDNISHGKPRPSRTEAVLMADTHRPPLYRIKITPKAKPC